MTKHTVTTPPDRTTWTHIEMLFHQARELDETAREQFLATLAGHVSEQVRCLLHASATHDTGFLEPPETTVVHQNHTAPSTIGGFRVLRTIARGGMGVVYEAEQTHPKRSVALKVLPLAVGLGGAARLEHEASVLARLLHPAIAQMYTIGADEQGTPFLAMELVESAQTLNAWSHGRSEKELLDVFMRVCHGVHHGHQRGVVHRDLKPSNVLVNDRNEPKIIDFGIARRTQSGIARVTQDVDRSKLLGTLAYMSPEQCAGDSDEISAQTDIYSLGVVLYELLTGTLPHPVDSKPLTEAIRLVRETSPRKPMRNEKPLPTDLQAIVMKAISRNPAGRYASASEFADDIERYLRNEPTRAQPPKALHAALLFARRHRAGVMSGIVIGAVLLGTIVTLGVMNSQLKSAQTQVVSERDAATQARDEATDARNEEQRHRTVAEQVAEVMRNSLRSANPELTKNAELTMREYLDQTSTMLDDIEDPYVASNLHLTISEAYFAMGQYQSSLDHANDGIKRAETSLPPDTSKETRLLLMAPLIAAKGSALSYLGRGEDAIVVMQTTLDLLKETGQYESAACAEILSRVGDAKVQMGNFAAAQQTFEECLSIRETLFQPPDIDLGESHNNLANVLWQQGKRDDAETHWRAALDNFTKTLHEAHPFIATVLGNLGQVYEMQGDHENAQSYYTRSLQLREQMLGKDNLKLAISWERLGILYNTTGRYSDSDHAFGRMHDIRDLHLDESHPHVANGILNQAYAYIQREDFARANELLERAMKIHEQIYPPEHPAVGGAMFLRARALVGIDNASEALPLARRSWELRTASYGRESWRAANSQSLYGECLLKTGDVEASRLMLTEAMGFLQASLPPGHELILQAQERLDLLETVPEHR